MNLFGRCCGGLCCLAVCALLALGSASGTENPATAGSTGESGCATEGAATPAGLTELEGKIVAYVADRLEADGPAAVDLSELVERFGLSEEDLAALDEARLRAATRAELARRNFDLTRIGGHCERFRACSVDRNLMNATGEELERYEAEVALDGMDYGLRPAPEFTLPRTDGGSFSLSARRGTPVAIVMLSGHCVHSLDTLPVIEELKRKYPADRLEILPVFVNSGDVEHWAARAWELELEFPLAVSEGKEISEAFDSRMVPSTFLIDGEGRLVRKYVGFKDLDTLDRAIGEWLGAGS